MLENVVLAYGGLDSVIVTAGVFVPPDRSGHVEDKMWDLTFGINVKGAYIVADEAYKVFKKQGLTGNIAISKNQNLTTLPEPSRLLLANPTRCC